MPVVATLRRSLSSPSVRRATTPYAVAATHGSGHRRSTGSETSNRRVLADIEWWRVLPEQESEDLDQDQEDDLHDHGVPEEVPVPTGAERLSTSQHLPGSPEMPVVEMAALSIAPTTPRRHALESSSSSLESTPESANVQAEHPYLDLGALNFGLQDTDVPSPRTRNGTSPPFLSTRPHSFADFASSERQYADFAMSPLSSSPVFSN